MSVTIRPYRRGGWEVDIRVVTPDGMRQLRERKRAPMSSRSAALRWAEGRERLLFQRLMDPPPTNTPPKEVPTLREFAPRFVDGHARANRQKPSGIAAKEMILRVHLLPAWGHRKLDTIKSEDVQRLKRTLEAKSPKTVNNILTVLSVLLKKAVEWEVIERVPCSVKLLPIAKGSTTFYDFDDYERLVEAARVLDPRTHLIVLLGGEAGLRCGEIIALEWADLDLINRQACIRRSDWNGHVTTPKGGRLRRVPLTRRLTTALRDHRHLRSPRVLCQDTAEPLTRQMVQTRVKRAACKAGLSHAGVHILRHTFCSHLAMRGAPPRAIQELAGHKELSMTQRYMHLSPAALDAAIRLLEQPAGPVQPGRLVQNRGDVGETAPEEVKTINKSGE
jgi:integrase